MSYAPSKVPKILGLGVVAFLISPFLVYAAQLMWQSGLAEYFHLDPRADWPLATDEHAKIAATACGIEEWQLGPAFTFHGPPPEEPFFGYEIASLPAEEVPFEGPGEGRSWDRTERIDSINTCLCASFDEQQVRAILAAPALHYSIHGPNASESGTF